MKRKKELSEDTLNDLNDKFNQLDNGSLVRITFYKNGKYSEIKGRVTILIILKRKFKLIKNTI